MKLQPRDDMTDAEFDTMTRTGLAQAKAGESYSADEAFEKLRMSNTE